MFAAALPLEVFADDWQSKDVLDISGNDYDYMGEHASPSLYSSGASCSMDYVYVEGDKKTAIENLPQAPIYKYEPALREEYGKTDLAHPWKLMAYCSDFYINPTVKVSRVISPSSAPTRLSARSRPSVCAPF